MRRRGNHRARTKLMKEECLRARDRGSEKEKKKKRKK